MSLLLSDGEYFEAQINVANLINVVNVISVINVVNLTDLSLTAEPILSITINI